MKQRVTEEQIKDLTKGQMIRLTQWAKRRKDVDENVWCRPTLMGLELTVNKTGERIPMLTIGEMFEFLDDMNLYIHAVAKISNHTKVEERDKVWFIEYYWFNDIFEESKPNFKLEVCDDKSFKIEKVKRIYKLTKEENMCDVLWRVCKRILK